MLRSKIESIVKSMGLVTREEFEELKKELEELEEVLLDDNTPTAKDCNRNGKKGKRTHSELESTLDRIEFLEVPIVRMADKPDKKAAVWLCWVEHETGIYRFHLPTKYWNLKLKVGNKLSFSALKDKGQLMRLQKFSVVRT